MNCNYEHPAATDLAVDQSQDNNDDAREAEKFLRLALNINRVRCF